MAFGGFGTPDNVLATYFVNSLYNNGTTAVCQAFGCTICTTPVVIDNTTSILSTDILYLVEREKLVASAVFIDSLTQSSDTTLVLMIDPQSDHSFIYYAVSVDFIGDYLKDLHSNDHSMMRVTALVSNTEVRIAPSHNVNIDGSVVYHGEEIIFTLNVGETLTVSSSEDLTGSRITSNRAVSFYSGHYCAFNKTTNCSILNEQIPPYNSWGNTFILNTNISGLRGNMFKVVASDFGANVSMNCTTNGADYEANNFVLGFRQHTVLSVYHDYCTVRSDEDILIIQFRDSSPPVMDTFMTIIPALVHYKDNYVLTAHEDVNNYIAITVKDTNPTHSILMSNDNPIAESWQMIELDGDEYYLATSMLTAGRHVITFSGSSITFGVIIYGSSHNDTFALPAGMRLNMAKNLPHAG